MHHNIIFTAYYTIFTIKNMDHSNVYNILYNILNQYYASQEQATILKP